MSTEAPRKRNPRSRTTDRATSIRATPIPTISMFEERLRLLEGAEACRATASGMAAVFAALACLVKAGDRVVASRALFGSCLYIINTILPRYGVETELVDGRDLDAWRRALSKPAKAVFCETPSNPDPRARRSQGGGGAHPRRGRASHRRQCLRHAAPAEAAGARRRRRRLFRDQAHRRPRPQPRRRGAGIAASSSASSSRRSCAIPARRSARSMPGCW